MAKTRNFGTNVDEELLAEFKKKLPRTYSIRQWMEAMMRHTLDMSEAELEAVLTTGRLTVIFEFDGKED